MSENEFEHEGAHYRAEKATNGCEGCAFVDARSHRCAKLPPCTCEDREDGREVIFVRAD